jgi:hypothetical protein
MTEHDKLLENIVRRLRRNRKYIQIDKNLEYCVAGITGEVDILVMLTPMKYNQRFNFYEIKCHDTHKAYTKAKEQYARYVMAHPWQRVKGVYISSEKVRRLR